MNSSRPIGHDGVRNDALDARRLPPVLLIVLYNGGSWWQAALEVGGLIAPVDPWFKSYQPVQRYIVVDERHVGAEDLPMRNLMRAVLGLEQNRTLKDVMRVAGLLAEWMYDPRDDGLKRAFTDQMWRLIGQFEPGDAELPTVQTLEDLRVTLEERLAEWPRQQLQQGHEQGLAHEHVLLRRLAASRFGAETAERLSGVQAGSIADLEGFAEVGE